MNGRQHKHLIVQALVKNPPIDKESINSWIENTVNVIDMKILSGPHTCYADVPGNEGWTGIAIIEFSHIAVHVWERDVPPLIELDIFSCKTFSLQKVMDQVKQFGIDKCSILYIDRDENFGEYVKFYVFYKTTNLINGKIYYGVHGSNTLDKKYIGSGKILKQAIKKYGKNNFKTDFLQFFFDQKEAYQYEKNFLEENSHLLQSKNCYNIGVGGLGGKQYLEQKVWITDGENNKFIDKKVAVDDFIGFGWEYGRMVSSETKQKMSESNKGKPSPNKGRKFTEEQKQKIKDNMTPERRLQISKTHWLNNGGKISEETKQKMSTIQKLRVGKPGTTTGRNWFNNTIEEKLYDVGTEPDGWLRGRLTR